MPVPGRAKLDNDYRYGFNGMETDPEAKGAWGNQNTTYFRQYDARLGRWFSTDPVTQPFQSPYNSMDGKPIILNDPLGDKAGPGRGFLGRIFGKGRLKKVGKRRRQKGWLKYAISKFAKGVGSVTRRALTGSRYRGSYIPGRYTGSDTTYTLAQNRSITGGQSHYYNMSNPNGTRKYYKSAKSHIVKGTIAGNRKSSLNWAYLRVLGGSGNSLNGYRGMIFGTGFSGFVPKVYSNGAFSYNNGRFGGFTQVFPFASLLNSYISFKVYSAPVTGSRYHPGKLFVLSLVASYMGTHMNPFLNRRPTHLKVNAPAIYMVNQKRMTYTMTITIRDYKRKPIKKRSWLFRLLFTPSQL